MTTTIPGVRIAPAEFRTSLYSASGRNAGRLVEAEMKRLEEGYARANKGRKIPATMLFLSNAGTIQNPVMGIEAHYTQDQRADVEFLRRLVSPSQA